VKCRKKVNANENEKSIREKMEAEANGEQMERVADGTREFIRCLFRLQTTFWKKLQSQDSGHASAFNKESVSILQSFANCFWVT